MRGVNDNNILLRSLYTYKISFNYKSVMGQKQISNRQDLPQIVEVNGWFSKMVFFYVFFFVRSVKHTYSAGLYLES